MGLIADVLTKHMFSDQENIAGENIHYKIWKGKCMYKRKECQ